MVEILSRDIRRRGMIASSPQVLLGVGRIADLLIVLATGWIAYWLRHGDPELPVEYLVAIGLGMVFTANAFQVARLYRLETIERPLAQLARVVTTSLAVGMLLLAVGFFAKTSAEYSRLWFATWLVLNLFGLLAFRSWLTWRIQSWQEAGYLHRNVVIVGCDERAKRLIEHLRQQGEDPGIELQGVFADDAAADRPESVAGAPMLGGIDDLLRYIRTHQVHEVLVALPWPEEARIDRVLTRLREAPVDVSLAPEPYGYHLLDRRVSHLGGVPMTTVQERPLSGWNLVIKEIEDRVLSFLIIVAFLPLMLAIALLVRLDTRGPAIFRQQRAGFNNDTFTVYKFRTMRSDEGDARGGAQARRGDGRLTRVGRFLRQTSLDELPQLFNVLKGDMSLVGPRPHAIAHNEAYAGLIDQYLGRHKVKPGITGWAQVHGLRGETDTHGKMARRVQYDLYYIDNWSLWLDLRILVWTLFVGFVHKNAY